MGTSRGARCEERAHRGRFAISVMYRGTDADELVPLASSKICAAVMGPVESVACDAKRTRFDARMPFPVCASGAARDVTHVLDRVTTVKGIIIIKGGSGRPCHVIRRVRHKAGLCEGPGPS